LSKSGPKPRNYFEEIPFELVNDKIIIPVRIGGEEYRFLLDTGAPTIVSQALAKTLELETLVEIPVGDVTGKKKPMGIVLLPEIALGDTEFRKIRSLVNTDDSNLVFGCFEIDGFIGSNLLRSSIVQLDVRQQKLIITDKRKRLNLDKARSAPIALVGEQKSPWMVVEVSGEEKTGDQLLIDTGSDDVYDLSSQVYDVLSQKRIFVPKGESMGASSIGLFGAGDQLRQYRLLLPRLRVPGLELTNLAVVTTPDTHSRIGTGLFHYTILTLDYRKKRVYFDPYVSTAEVDQPVRDISLSVDENGLIVGHVWSDELKDKLNFGDRILLLDGEPYELCNIIRTSDRFQQRDTLTLRVKPSQGEVFDLVLGQKRLSEE
jgi:hypothetical protein